MIQLEKKSSVTLKRKVTIKRKSASRFDLEKPVKRVFDLEKD